MDEHSGIFLESTSDNTSAIYVKKNNDWTLFAIINFDNIWAKPWPEEVGDDDMKRFRLNCITYPVKFLK